VTLGFEMWWDLSRLYDWISPTYVIREKSVVFIGRSSYEIV